MLRRFQWIVLLLFTLDILFTEVALYRSDLVRRALEFGKHINPALTFLNPYIYLIVALIWPIVFHMAGVYRPELALNFLAQAKRLVVAIPIATFVFSGVLYFSFRDVSRLMIFYFVTLDLAALALLRLLVNLALQLLPGRSQPSIRVLIVGANEMGRAAAQAIKKQFGASYTIVGFADDCQPVEEMEYPVLGPVDKTPYLTEVYGCDQIIVALPRSDSARLEQVVYDLQTSPVHIHVVPDLLGLAMVRARVEEIGGLPLIGLREPVIEGGIWVAKRVFDLVLSVTALFFLWPLMLLFALLIKLDSPGPAIFKQRRVGENNRPFWIYKFRTMIKDAGDVPPKLHTDKEGHTVFKLPNDPRVTRVGRILRRTSLDELPNLFNVIKGEMSIVGPRPEIWTIAEGYEPWQRGRLAVPPGLTGWWQVSGRSDLPMHLNTQYDLYYVHNYSMWLDMKILLKTIAAVIKSKGAY